MARADFLEEKRIKFLEMITPICNAFNIKEYDYEIDVGTGAEFLKIYNVKICCSMNSENSVMQELIGYLFLCYWKERSLGAFGKQVRNVIKQYWKEEKSI